jgi:hypothetical protein
MIQGVLLLYEYATAHRPHVAMVAATDCGFEILPYLPYFPDLVPSDFYLFSETENQASR